MSHVSGKEPIYKYISKNSKQLIKNVKQHRKYNNIINTVKAAIRGSYKNQSRYHCKTSLKTKGGIQGLVKVTQVVGVLFLVVLQPPPPPPPQSSPFILEDWGILQSHLDLERLIGCYLLWERETSNIRTPVRTFVCHSC